MMSPDLEDSRRPDAPPARTAPEVDRWREVKQLFFDALQLPSEQRESIVAGAARDERVREDVLSLLAVYDLLLASGGDMEGFLQRLDATRPDTSGQPTKASQYR